MPTQVDERVVRMQFDNAQFEQKMRGTMSLLDKFEDKLEFKNASKGLEEVQHAADKVDLSPLEGAADKVAVKFDLMSTIVVTQINKMVDAAVSAGERMVKALTIDQVTAGFEKYTEKTEAVQTIMNATGRSIEDVNNALAKLQWFSDETSYSFVDMTSNVGKFTSAGIDLDVAVSAMQGIANAAADAGANTGQASRAMYNFSQALSKGYVQLIDWKSIENATMSTVTFKQALIDSAVEMGTLTKRENDYLTVKGNEMSATKNFNDTLQDQWLTTEVLLDALGKYSAYSDQIYEVSDAFDTCADAMAATSEEGMELGARAFKAAQQARSFKDAVDATKDAVSSGWMRTFEIIFGNFNESVELWTEFTNTLWDIFASGAEGRNELLAGGLMSGWNQFMELGIADSERLKENLIEIGSAGDENFSKMIEAAGGFEKSLKDGWLTADVLRKGIDNIVEEITSLDSAELRNRGYTQESIDSFIALKNSIDDGSVSLEEFAKLMSRPSGRENLISAAKSAFESLTQIIEPLKAALRELFPPVTVEQIYNITVGIKNFCDGLKVSTKAAITLQAVFKLMLVPVKLFVALVQVAIKWIGTFITIIWMVTDAVFSFMAEAGSVNKILKRIFGDERYERLAAAWTKITTKLQGVFQKLGAAISNIGDLVVNQIGPKVLSVLKGIWNFVSPLVDKILDGIVWAVEWIADFSFEEVYEEIKAFVQELAKQFPWLADLIDTCYNAIKDFFDWIQTVTIMDVLYAIRDSFEEAAMAVWDFVKSIDFAGIWKKVLDVFEPAIEIFQKIGQAIAAFVKKLTPAKVLVFAFGAALVMFMMNISGVAKAVTNLLDVVSGGFRKIVAAIKISPILQIAGAIVILTGALITLALIDPNRLWSAISALGALAGGLVALTAISTGLSMWISKVEGMSSSFKAVVASMGIVAAAIVALALAMTAVKDIPAEDMLKKISILAGAIAALEVVMLLITKFSSKFEAGMKDMLAMGLALLSVAAVFKIVASTKVDDWGGTILAFTSIVGALIALSQLCNGIKFSNGAGLIAMTLSLLVLTGTLKLLAKTNPNELLEGILNMQPVVLALLEMAILLRIAGSKAKGTGAAIIAMIAMMYSMIGVINLVADISWGSIGKGLATLAGIAAIMALLMGTIQAVDKNKKVARGTTGTILVVAIAIGALSLVVAAIGKLDIATLAKGVAVVAILEIVIGQFVKTAQGAVKAKGAIWSIVMLIGVISSAIALLSLIDWTDATPAAIELGIVIAAIGQALKGMSGVKWGSALTSGLSMTAVIAVATIALKKLSELDPLNVLADAVGLGVVLTAIGAAIKIGTSGSLTESNVKEFNKVIKQLYIALGAITIAFIVLSKVGTSETNMLAGAVGIGAVLNALASAILIFSKANLTEENVAQFKKMGLSLGAAILIISVALAGLSRVDPGGSIAGATALGIAMNLVAMAINGLMRANFTDAKIKNLNDVMVSVVVLVTFMGLVMSLLAGVGKGAGSILASGIAMGVAVDAVAYAINILQKSGLTKPRVTNANNIAIAIGGFIVAIGGSLTLISAFGKDWKSILASAAGMSLCLVAVMAAVKLMSGSEFKKLKDIIGEAGVLAAFIAEITGALILMSHFDVQGAIPNATALGIAINAVALAADILASNGLKFSEALSNVLMLVPLIAAVGVVLWAINDADPAGNIAAAAALAIVIGVLTASLVLFKLFDVKFKDALGGIGAFIAFTALMAGLATGLGALTNIEGVGGAFEAGCEVLNKLFSSLTPILITALVFTGVLALIGKGGSEMIEAAAIGAAVFDLIVIIVGALVAALGARVEYIDGARDVLEGGVEAFTLLGDAIGGFFGHIVGAFVGGTTSGLQEAAQNVSDFIDQVTPALEIFASAELGTAAQNLKDLGAAMLELVGGDVLKGLTGDEDPLGTFGDELEDFAEPLKNFLTSINDLEVDQTKIDNAIAAAKGLADFASQLPKEDGFWQSIAGEAQSIRSFANQLSGGENGVSLAQALVDFSNTIEKGKFNADLVETATNSAKMISEFASSLPLGHGTWQDIFGQTQSIKSFATQLVGGTKEGGVSLADALVSFSSTLTKGQFNEDIVTKGAKAAKMLADFASALPVTGGTWADFAGETEDISDFARDLVGQGAGKKSLAEALVSFSNTLTKGNFNEDIVTKGVNAASMLSSFADSLGTTGGALEWFTGEGVTLGSFGDDLKKFGQGFDKFYKSVKDIKVYTVTSAMQALNKVWDFAKTINEDDDYDPKKGTMLSDVGDDLFDFSDTLVDFNENIQKVDLEKAKSVIEVVKTFADTAAAIDMAESLSTAGWSMGLQGIADAGIDAFLDEFTGSSEDVSTAIQSFLQLVTDALDTRADTVFPDTADSVVQTWNDELTKAFNEATSTTDVAAAAITNTINGLNFDLTGLGQGIVDTFGAGLTDYQSSLEESITTAFGGVPDSISAAIGNVEGANSLSYDAGVKLLTDLVSGAQSQSETTNTSFNDLGSGAADSFIDGLTSVTDDMTDLTTALDTLATTICDELNSAFNLDQEHSKLWDIGKAIADGLSVGIKDNQATPANASIKMAENLLQVIKNYLEIHSPSRVMRDEVGRYIVQGIADGITMDMSAEEAAKKKAENILNAFKEVTATLDNDDSIADLEYKLWEGTNQDASDSRKAEKKAELYEKQLKTQGQRVDAAQAAWKATVQQFGESSEEAQDAYVQYLQAQNTLMELASNAAELDKQLAEEEDDSDTLKAYNEYFLAHYNDVEDGLKTEAQLWAEAASATGYGQKKLEQSQKYFGTDVQSIMDKYTSRTVDVVTETAEEIQQQIYENTKEAASSGTGSGISDGIAEALGSIGDLGSVDIPDFEIPDLTEQVQQAIEAAGLGDLDSMLDMSWSDIFNKIFNMEGDGSIATLISNFAGGFDGLIDKGKDWAINFANTCIDWIESTFGINSPSKVMQEIGGYLMEGLALGVNDDMRLVNASLSGLVDNVLGATDDMGGSLTDIMTEENAAVLQNALNEAIQQAVAYIQNSEIGQPVIRPVLDLSEVQRGMSTLGLGHTPRLAMAVDSQFSANKEAAIKLQNGSGNQQVVNYNFNQTNTSPKALNPSIIYRQSRNLFSQLKMQKV